MAYFPSLPADAGVRHIVSLNPAAGRALIELHEAALRNILLSWVATLPVAASAAWLVSRLG